MVTFFVFKNLIRTGNCLLLSDRLHVTTLAFLKEKYNGLHEMIDKKNAFLFI